MKQSLTVFVSVAVCSVLLVVLMWAPFSHPMPAGQIVKYALIGALLGLVFYAVGLRKTVTRSRVVNKPAPQKQVGKKRKAR